MLFATAKLEQKQAQNQIFEVQIFPQGGGGNSLIISTMKNLFLLIFHLADYQAVTSATKRKRGNPRKTLIFCALQILTKDYGHAHKKYWLIGQNTHICSACTQETPT